MKVVRTEPLRNTSITTLCAKSFYHAETDAALYKHAEQLFGDLWRAGVYFHVCHYCGSTAEVEDADGVSWKYFHDYPVVALAGAAEMASGRRAEIQIGNTRVKLLVPASMADYEKERFAKE
jgi:hypothetical protein